MRVQSTIYARLLPRFRASSIIHVRVFESGRMSSRDDGSGGWLVPKDAFWEKLSGSVWVFIGLAVLVVVAVWLVVRIRAWSRDGEDPAAADHRMLSHLSELRREGNLSEEEYRSIKGRLAKKIEGSVRPRDGQQPPAPAPPERAPDAST